MLRTMFHRTFDVAISSNLVMISIIPPPRYHFYSIRLFLLWAEFDDNVGVGDYLICWYITNFIMTHNKNIVISFFASFVVALCHSDVLISKSSGPNFHNCGVVL